MKRYIISVLIILTIIVSIISWRQSVKIITISDFKMPATELAVFNEKQEINQIMDIIKSAEKTSAPYSASMYFRMIITRNSKKTQYYNVFSDELGDGSIYIYADYNKDIGYRITEEQLAVLEQMIGGTLIGN